MPRLNVQCETWPLAEKFAISRGAKTSALPVVAIIEDENLRGRGECLPYGRYGETVEGVADAIRALGRQVEAGMGREELRRILPAGAARNALDCALWDLEARKAGRPVWDLAGLSPPGPVITAYTIALGSPEAMAKSAARHSNRPLLKMKLAGDGDLERVAAVRAAAPGARLIVDANEGWTGDMAESFSMALAELGVEAIEQPLPAGADEALADFQHPVPIYADESCHDRAGLGALSGKYDGINIKLDKAGGLTEALDLRREAKEAGLKIMVGCMVATSLAMAPAMLLAQGADIVDLDGPLLLARDREGGLRYVGSEVWPSTPDLWG